MGGAYTWETLFSTSSRKLYANQNQYGQYQGRPFDFMNRNILVRANGGNLDFYRFDSSAMVLGTPIQTIPKPSGLPGVASGTVPVYVSTGNNHEWYIYRGTDNHVHKVDANFSADTVISGYDDYVPYGPIGTNGIFFAKQTAPYNNRYFSDFSTFSESASPDNTVTSASRVNAMLSSGTGETTFKTDDGNVVQWNTSCAVVRHNVPVF